MPENDLMQEILYVLMPNLLGLTCQFDIVGRLWWCRMYQATLI